MEESLVYRASVIHCPMHRKLAHIVILFLPAHSPIEGENLKGDHDSGELAHIAISILPAHTPIEGGTQEGNDDFPR